MLLLFVINKKYVAWKPPFLDEHGRLFIWQLCEDDTLTCVQSCFAAMPDLLSLPHNQRKNKKQRKTGSVFCKVKLTLLFIYSFKPNGAFFVWIFCTEEFTFL